MRWVGHVARVGKGRGVCSVLVGKPEGKRPLGRPKRRWKDNIKTDLRETGIDRANWIQLAQDRVQWRACVSSVMNLWVL
jgi:transcription termination factor 2